jgi:phage tail-like protein
MTDSDRRDDPYRSFNFRVIVDDVSIGEFSEVRGLTAEGDAIEVANSQSTVRKLVGLHKYTNITLKRGTSHCGVGIARAKVIAAISLSN